LNDAANFYKKLGCTVARSYEDRVNINFFGDQVVCHLSPDKIDSNPQMYPRHFGITIKDGDEYDRFLEQVKSEKLPFFKEPFCRYEGKKEEHRSFLLIDPSNNLIEFKYYKNSEMMY
jgi:hypothetical protein